MSKQSFTQISDEQFQYCLELESEWRKNRKYISEYEILQDIPDALPIIWAKIIEWHGKQLIAEKTIRAQAKIVNEVCVDEFLRWFTLEFLSIQPIGKELAECYRQLDRLRGLKSHLESKSQHNKQQLPIEQARTTPIDLIAARYTSLRMRGHRMYGLCPLHQEKTASFTLYLDSNSFYCHGCHIGGDVIKLIQQMEGIGFLEAVELLAKEVL